MQSKLIEKIHQNGFQGLRRSGYQYFIRGVATQLVKTFPGVLGKYIRNPIFVIGCGRSGTSILTRLIASHNKVCNFSEANRIWDPKGYPWWKKRPNRPPIWFDATGWKKGWKNTYNKSLKKIIKGVFGAFQFLNRKDFFLNKSPMNSFRIREILEMLPGSQFIHIYRDGRAVALSWAKKQLANNRKHPKPYKIRELYLPFEKMLKKIGKSWVTHIQEIRDKVSKLNLDNKGKIIEISYEDLCENTLKNVKRILSYLKLPEENMNFDRFGTLENRNYKWKNELNNKTIKSIEKVMSPTLFKLGYETYL